MGKYSNTVSIQRCRWRLKQVGLIKIDNETFKQKGFEGRPSWSGTITRNRLSKAWDDGTPQEREELYKFVKETLGTDWPEYARRTRDFLNARILGLVGPTEPQFDKTVDEIIALNDN